MVLEHFEFIKSRVGNALPFDLPPEELWLYASPEAWRDDALEALDKALHSCSEIDWKLYGDAYPDVAQAAIEPYAHFTRYGINENRKLFSSCSFLVHGLENRIKSRTWLGTISGLDPHKIWGIVHPEKTGQLSPPALLHNGKVICKARTLAEATDTHHNPVGAKHASFSFLHVLKDSPGIKGCYSIHDSDNLEFIASLPYYLPSSLSEKELSAYAASLHNEKDHYQAYLCHMALYLRFGFKKEYLREGADQLVLLGYHQHAEALYELYLKAGGEPTLEMARHLLAGRKKTPDIVKKALYRYFRLTREKVKLDILREVLGLLSFLIRHAPGEMLKHIYDNLLISLLLLKRPELSSRYPHFISLFPVSMCLVCGRAPSLKTFAQVLKQLPEFILDIVLISKRNYDKDYIREFGLEEFRILYGLAHLKNYKIFISDQVFFGQIRKEYDLSLFRVIGYPHGVELEGLYPADLFLTSSQYQACTPYTQPTSCMTRSTLTTLQHLPPKTIQEISVSGPFQNDPQAFGRYDKSELRAMLAEKFKREIPSDKPLIFVMEDGHASLRQLVYMMNRLVNSCTIIYKYVFFHSDKLVASISPKVIIETDTAYSPDMLKCASDFILCGPYGSTPLSSLMFGLNFLPYYSRISYEPKTDPVQYIKSGHPKSGARTITNYADESSKGRFLSRWPYFFDLVDTEAIRTAIFGASYVDWYKEALPGLRKEILGEYLIEGCAELTARYVTRFASQGTLGQECAMILIK